MRCRASICEGSARLSSPSLPARSPSASPPRSFLLAALLLAVGLLRRRDRRAARVGADRPRRRQRTSRRAGPPLCGARRAPARRARARRLRPRGGGARAVPDSRRRAGAPGSPRCARRRSRPTGSRSSSPARRRSPCWLSAVSAHATGELDRVLVAPLALLALASFEAVSPLPLAARELRLDCSLRDAASSTSRTASPLSRIHLRRSRRRRAAHGSHSKESARATQPTPRLRSRTSA